jgi:hypothetical protein
MVLRGRISRVDVGRPSVVRTASGVGIGSTEDEVMRTYAGRIRVEPHPYTGRRGGQYLIYTPADPSDQHLSLIFETDGQRVVSFRAGLKDAVGLIEGCA